LLCLISRNISPRSFLFSGCFLHKLVCSYLKFYSLR
jgi:hypothetical protein